MKKAFVLGACALLLSACASAASEQDDDAIETAVQGFYASYQRPGLGSPDWEEPIYSLRTTRLIGQWRVALGDEPIDDLSSFGWLCECQDWDETKFAVTITRIEQRDADHAVADVTIDLGWDAKTTQQLELVWESDGWHLDNIRSDSFPNGLVAELEAAAK
ncbi:MAG: DUF3828 domain-containing protein [Sphingomonadaceae bacterium]|nr:DUF3828 domain-containing protein [Sphingomonadaceae bacterium]